MTKQYVRDFLDAMDEFMDNIVDEIFAKSQENLVRDGKVDTANLLKSGNVNRRYLEKEIVYTAPHAEAVEFGRSPGIMPPPDALIKWCERKLGVNPKEAKNVAFAVALAIKQRGIEPSPYLRPAIEAVESSLR